MTPVLFALLQMATPESASTPASPPTCERGIHLVTNAEPRATRLLPEKLTDHRRIGNPIMGALVAGLSHLQARAVLNGARAELRLTDRRPVFLFCDPPVARAPRQPGTSMEYVGGGGQDVSPASLPLVRLDAKAKQREMPLADIGAFASPKKSFSKRVIPLQVREIGPGIYEVSPKDALQPGEYAFFRENQTETSQALKSSVQDQVVEFGVDD